MKKHYGQLTPRRIIAYLAGLLLLAFGIAASVRSNLGSSPVASVPYMFNLLSGIELGYTTILWQTFLVLCQFLILRKAFPPGFLLQLVTGFLFGYCNTFALWVLCLLPEPTGIVVRLLCTCCGFAVGGFGVWLYSSSKVMNMPSEGIVFVIAEKLHQPFHRVKIGFDVFSVLLAGTCCLIGIGSLGSVGVGTVIIAVMLGTMVGVYERFWGKKLRSFLGTE